MSERENAFTVLLPPSWVPMQGERVWINPKIPGAKKSSVGTVLFTVNPNWVRVRLGHGKRAFNRSVNIEDIRPVPDAHLPITASDAVFSPSKMLRYLLYRGWNLNGPICAFIMLHPANAETNDPTVNRCISFARGWGFGSLYVGNLYAYRSTNPSFIERLEQSQIDAFGENAEYLADICRKADLIVAAWGNCAMDDAVQRFREVVGNRPVRCLRMTKAGRPVHPLYVKVTSNMQPLAFWNCDGHATKKE